MSVTSLPPAPSQEALAAAHARWRATVEAELKGASFDKKLVTPTPEGVALQPLYTRADLADLPALDARPGEAPYLRGVRAAGYKTAPWRVAQEIAADSPGEFNAALRRDLASGQDAVVLPRGGLALTGVDDFATALAGVELGAVPVYLEAGADAAPLASCYLEYARRAGQPWLALTGSLAADPLGERAATGGLPAPLPVLYDSLAGWTRWAHARVPALKTIGVNAARWGDAGGSATQELALALATAVDYLRALQGRGIDAADAAARCEFRFSAGPQFFTEIAKFRAFRPLWTRVVTAFGAKPEAAALATLRVSTSRWDQTLLDPHVNMLRVTTEALSAVLGGCDALHIAPFDEVTGATTDFSRRIARNVHVLLAEEFNFAEVADPAGGSWYLEKLTDELARKAWTLFQDIEQRGGMAAALESGYAQQLVGKTATEKRDGIARRRIGIVGTNLFPNLKETPLIPRTAKTATTGETPSTAASAPVTPSHADWPTRFDAALALARDGGTIAQLGRFMRGETAPVASTAPLALQRGAADFEQLRTAAATFTRRTGVRPRVFLAKMGPLAQHKARADFSAGFFATGGFETLARHTFETAEQAAEAALASGAQVTVLCSTDDSYPALVPAFAAAVKASKPALTVVLAGLPADPALVQAFTAAGIDEFIHVRANVFAVLAKLQKQIGANV